MFVGYTYVKLSKLPCMVKLPNVGYYYDSRDQILTQLSVFNGKFDGAILNHRSEHHFFSSILYTPRSVIGMVRAALDMYM